MIRFQILQEGADPIFTEWEAEPLRAGTLHTATQRMTELRQTYGSDARISIERATVIEEPDRRQVRFKIETKKSTHYSLPFPIAERVKRLVEMKEKHRKATITEEIVK